MRDSVFLQMEFFALVATSLLLPVAIYVYLFRKQAISRRTVLIFASILIALSGTDVVLLQLLAEMAKLTRSTADEKLFSSELAITLYILPAIFAGIAVNLISHVLIRHLDEAEQKFKQQQPKPSLWVHFHLGRKPETPPQPPGHVP